MSAIAGIFNLDGATVPPGLIEQFTSAMQSRGPDERKHWNSGSVALGHCMLRTTPESLHEHQPLQSQDGRLTLVFDGRLDNREELRRDLALRGAVIRDDTDSELVLHAYALWGEECPGKLLGDFVFAVWNESARQLFCARDHLGIRPLFYAALPGAFMVASDPTALLLAPGVTDELNETAVGDFLLFGGYLDDTLSIYKMIHRLPAGHSIQVSSEGVRRKRYWHFPSEYSVYYRRQSEYIDHFRSLLTSAVLDRARGNNIAVGMSGGLDSTSIAAILKSHGHAITAFTGTCGSMIPDDQEGLFAGMVSSELGFPIVYRSLSEYKLFEKFDSPLLKTSEPTPSPNIAYNYDTFTDVSARGIRIFMSGYQGDAIFAPSRVFFRTAFRNLRIFQVVRTLNQFRQQHGSLRGSGLRRMLFPSSSKFSLPLPKWLDSDFSSRLRLEERFQLAWDIYDRADTCDQLQRPWLGLGSTMHEFLPFPFVSAYPFLDIRLVLFMTGLEPHLKPDKFVLRAAMDKLLPDQVRLRPKTGASEDLVRIKIERGMLGPKPDIFVDVLAQKGYVDAERFGIQYEAYKQGAGASSTFNSGLLTQAMALNLWMKQAPCSTESP